MVLGGTLTELAIAQRRVDGLVDWVRELGLSHVEVSDGTITLDHAEKLRLIERLAADFTVFSEVGSKDAAKIMAPYRWVEQIADRAGRGRLEGDRRGARDRHGRHLSPRRRGPRWA